MKPVKQIRNIVPSYMFGTKRTKQILNINPTAAPKRADAEKIKICVFDYTADKIEEKELKDVGELNCFKSNGNVTWINIDGLRKDDVEKVSEHFGIHPLLTEDILSLNQRPKMDELDGILFCLLNMLYYNETSQSIEQEQISIVLGEDFVISWQEDAEQDVFDPIRQKLRLGTSKLRQKGADYLCYSMLDLIVDDYFIVMEKMGEVIEGVEDEIIRSADNTSMARINQLRKEMIVMKRNITPVRDIIGAIGRSDSELIQEQTLRYFKDIQDHITQAYDLSENYRDILVNMQDLYINNVNLKMNQVMKVIAIVTCLLAPATVIGGIFGMNFDRNVNFFHKPWGFYTAVFLMIACPIGMLYFFRKRGWF